MGYYSFNRPQRDGRLSWPCWLTDSGRRTHKVVKQPSISLAQDKENPLARTDVLTTMLLDEIVTIAFLSQLTHMTISIFTETATYAHILLCFNATYTIMHGKAL